MSSSSDVTSSPETNSASRLTGRVKWFNNKAGYGFVTITDGDKSGLDIFVHHSSIKVSNQQYKYLVQGEYIEFHLINVENSTHESQAAEVGGIKGGKLMCETRHEFKAARNNYRTTTPGSNEDNEYTEPVKLPRQQRVRNEVVAPVESTQQCQDVEGNSWSLVSKKPTKPTERQPSNSTSGRGRGRPPRSKVNL
uniref:CSD domain-containing protein n=1 Tax=viral metagenome TaxID=1070528 RepID=A0A6C0JKP9_9ZZZZ